MADLLADHKRAALSSQHTGQSIEIQAADTQQSSARGSSAAVASIADTRVSETHASDEAYAAAAEAFEPKDLVDLTIAVAAMNAFNRLGAPFRLPVAAKPWGSETAPFWRCGTISDLPGKLFAPCDPGGLFLSGNTALHLTPVRAQLGRASFLCRSNR